MEWTAADVELRTCQIHTHAKEGRFFSNNSMIIVFLVN